MTADPNDRLFIVVDSYDHDLARRVVVARSSYEPRDYLFFYFGLRPEVNFGDTIVVDFNKGVFYVSHGNSKLRFKLTPLIFPDTLLLELISERLNL